MSLQLLEGFSHYQITTTNLALKSWILASSITPINGSVNWGSDTGRVSGTALQMTIGAGVTSGPTSMSTTKILPGSYTTAVLGFAFKPVTVVAPAIVRPIANLSAGGATTIAVGLNGSRQLILINNAGTIVATGTTVLSVGSWYFIELRGFINGASGTGEVHLNGATEITSTTGNYGSSNIDRIIFQCSAQESGGSFSDGIISADFCDVYVVDTGGSTNNTFLGDMAVYTLYPSADGAHTQWTPDTGTAHFSRVNEHTGTYPDNDVSYVADSTSGDRDSYVYDDLVPLTGNVYGAQTNLWARKDNASLRQLKAVVRRSSTDYDGTAIATLGTTYADFTEIRETDPSTSAPWTISGINNAEFGVVVV